MLEFRSWCAARGTCRTACTQPPASTLAGLGVGLAVAGAVLGGAGLWSLCAYATGRGGVAHARYAVLARGRDGRGGAYELRRYAPAAAAVVTVPAGEGAGSDDARSLTSQGFRPLAGYIFGRGNARGESIAMTAPVVGEPSSRGPAGGVASVDVSFILPASHPSAAAAPPPVAGSRVRVVDLPERFELVTAWHGGYASDAATQDKGAALLEAARRDGYAPARAPPGAGVTLPREPAAVLLRTYSYDPPWTPTWVRLNEVALVVEGPLSAPAAAAAGGA